MRSSILLALLVSVFLILGFNQVSGQTTPGCVVPNLIYSRFWNYSNFQTVTDGPPGFVTLQDPPYTPYISEYVPNFNFTFGTGPVPASQNGTMKFQDYIAGVYTGNITFPFTASIILQAQVDDGVRLYLNGSLVIDRWVIASGNSDSTVLNVKYNTPYTFRLEYFERNGGAYLYLRWRNSTQPKSGGGGDIIPSNWFAFLACTDYSSCISQPCQNGGTCNAIPSNYTCTCPAGYMGVNCQTQYNSSFCANGNKIDLSPNPRTALASFIGDPHVNTFDGLLYSVYVPGTYYLVRSLNSTLVIQSQFEKCAPPSTGVCVRSIAIRYMGAEIILSTLPGVPQVQQFNIAGVMYISFKGTNYYIQTGDGVKLQVTVTQDPFLQVRIWVPSSYYKIVRGLAGTFDDNKANDFTTPQNNLVGNEQAFFSSWIVPDSENIYKSLSAVVPSLGNDSSSTCFNSSTPTVPGTIIPPKNSNFTNDTFVPSNTTINNSTCTNCTNYCNNLFNTTIVQLCYNATKINYTDYINNCVIDVLNNGYQTGSSNLDQYLTTCPTIPTCQYNCNNAGNCTNGTCACNPGYNGEFCDIPPGTNGLFTLTANCSGLAAGGYNITFVGTNLYGAISCQFGGSTTTTATQIAINTYTCTVPAQTTSTTELVVLFGNGKTTTTTATCTASDHPPQSNCYYQRLYRVFQDNGETVTCWASPSGTVIAQQNTTYSSGSTCSDCTANTAGPVNN